MDDAARHQWLVRFGERHGAGVRGKILQRLLELAFARIGFRLVDERIAEGIDFDIEYRADPGERYSFEARTTEGDSVAVKTEDLNQMKGRAGEGYSTGFAAIRVSPGCRWILVKRSWLLPPDLRVSVGTSPGWEDLADRVNDSFDQLLETLGPVALRNGLKGLKMHVDNAML
ncbi:MAG: hypothetical protein AAB403_22760 [Planctomycetota bacterium]